MEDLAAKPYITKERVGEEAVVCAGSAPLRRSPLLSSGGENQLKALQTKQSFNKMHFVFSVCFSSEGWASSRELAC